MRKLRKTALTSVAACIAFSVAQAAVQDYEQTVEEHFEVRKGGTLFLDSDRGSVIIRSHASNDVDIVVRLAADTRSRERADELFESFELSFEQRGKDVEIVGEWLDRWRRQHNRLKIHFDIRLPEEYNLDIETAGGSISVDDQIGEVKLHTSGGSISMGKIDGRVRAQTSGGSISLDWAGGEATVHTSGGSIMLGEIGGSVDAKTSGGTISVDGADGDLTANTSGGSLRLRNINGNLRGKTSGGSIHAELLRQITEPVDLKTSGGSIKLTVPPDFNADVDASTSGGRVIADVPMTVQGTFSKRSLEGRINRGGELIKLRTSGGNIEIRER